MGIPGGRDMNRLTGRKPLSYFTGRTHDGTGYVGVAKVTGKTVNIRAGASGSAKRLATAPKGAVFERRAGDVDGWTAIYYRGQEAYVSAKYVALITGLIHHTTGGRGALTITTELLLTGLAMCASMVTIITAIANTRRAGRCELEKSAGEREGVRRDLGHIMEGIEDIKAEQVKQRDATQDLCERVTRAEEKCQRGTAAHRGA